MLLLLIVDELMNLCLDCCWIMLLMLIHALGNDIYVVVNKLSLFDELLSKWVTNGNVDFSELE